MLFLNHLAFRGICPLTTGQDTFAGTGHDVFNAPLSGILHNQPTLTDGDSLTDTGVNTNFGPVIGQFFSSVLNATFDGNDTVGSLNIRGHPNLEHRQR